MSVVNVKEVFIRAKILIVLHDLVRWLGLLACPPGWGAQISWYDIRKLMIPGEPTQADKQVSLGSRPYMREILFFQHHRDYETP